MTPSVLWYVLRFCTVWSCCIIVGEGAFVAKSSVAWAQVPPPIPIAPPVAYPPNTWQGKGMAVLRVLDRLESHVEVLTIPVNTVRQYKNLTITVGRCLQRPPTLASDAAAWLDIRDTLRNSVPFHGWMLAAEPSLGILEDPLYDVQVIRCDGSDLPPQLPALPKPVVPHLPMVSSSISMVSDKVPDSVQTNTQSEADIQSESQTEQNDSFSSSIVSSRDERTLPRYTSPSSIQGKPQNRQDRQVMHSVLPVEKGIKLPPPVPFSTPWSGRSRTPEIR